MGLSPAQASHTIQQKREETVRRYARVMVCLLHHSQLPLPRSEKISLCEPQADLYAVLGTHWQGVWTAEFRDDNKSGEETIGAARRTDCDKSDHAVDMFLLHKGAQL